MLAYMPGWHIWLMCLLSSMLTNVLLVRSQPETDNFVLYVCCCVQVGPDYATFLLGTRDSVPMKHCSTLSQGVASASNNVWKLGLRDLGHLGAIRHCWKHFQQPGTAWNNVPLGHCPLSQGEKLHRLDRPYGS